MKPAWVPEADLDPLGPSPLEPQLPWLHCGLDDGPLPLREVRMTRRTGPASGTHSPGFPFLCLNRKRITAVTMLSKYVCIFKIQIYTETVKS